MLPGAARTFARFSDRGAQPFARPPTLCPPPGRKTRLVNIRMTCVIPCFFFPPSPATFFSFLSPIVLPLRGKPSPAQNVRIPRYTNAHQFRLLYCCFAVIPCTRVVYHESSRIAEIRYINTKYRLQENTSTHNNSYGHLIQRALLVFRPPKTYNLVWYFRFLCNILRKKSFEICNFSKKNCGLYANDNSFYINHKTCKILLSFYIIPISHFYI